MEAEEWRPVVGYEGRYEVSDLGRVRRTAPGKSTRPGRLLGYVNEGYRKVGLLRGGRGTGTTRTVHSLVLEAFVGPRPQGQEGLHKNGVALDCRLSNLHYGTKAENMADRIRHGVNPQINKTHCAKGHAYEGDNLAAANGGKWRRCRICQREWSKQYKLRKKEQLSQ